MSPTAPLLEFVDVEKRFGDFVALDRVSFSVDAGTVTCVVGPSGSGKSTMLRTINLLETIDAGGIFLDGELLGQVVRGQHRVPLARRASRKQVLNFGMVFQGFNLFPNLTAQANVALAPVVAQGVSRADALARATQLLRRVGLGDKLEHYPSELSGGQQQRVAIARALATEPKMLLFDEPTSALDPELVGEVLTVMRRLADDGATMIVVTHEMAFAEQVADDMIMMAEGRIVEQGRPRDVIHAPKTDRARRFFASVRTRGTEPTDD
ncbi:amino acid ABC transporter ATP-binding protein [Microbacterium sp. X-17]|uniref:amino acid ABC transporter ATP-binding protein n=1 Tax=Microbacterium sp. X-17 TaxID=3144404 RepID=UPI0031F4FD60